MFHGHLNQLFRNTASYFSLHGPCHPQFKYDCLICDKAKGRLTNTAFHVHNVLVSQQSKYLFPQLRLTFICILFCLFAVWSASAGTAGTHSSTSSFTQEWHLEFLPAASIRSTYLLCARLWVLLFYFLCTWKCFVVVAVHWSIQKVEGLILSGAKWYLHRVWVTDVG